MTQTTHKSDIEIAQEAKLLHISEIAQKAGIDEDFIDYYGKFKAKIDLSVLKDKSQRAKLILVTAITPTPAGEGKSTTTIGLGQALNKLGKLSIVALREPSLGPCFGVKGGPQGVVTLRLFQWRISIFILQETFTQLVLRIIYLRQ